MELDDRHGSLIARGPATGTRTTAPPAATGHPGASAVRSRTPATLEALRQSSAPWRRPTAVTIGVVGVVLYNWWVPVAVSGRLLTTPDELFSDLEATGRPDASLLQHLDLAAGLVLIVALLVRGRRGPNGPRAEWPWMLAFATAGAVGGQFSYACPEGLSAACRSAEWRLALPPHHYVHVMAGIVEFTCATIAVYLAWHRTRSVERPVTRVVRWTGRTMVAAYPLLALSYLTDRMGVFVEPIFFVAFSAMVLAELCETDRPLPGVVDAHRFVRLVPAARPSETGRAYASVRLSRVLDTGRAG